MESFTMNINGMMNIHTFVDGMKEWMSHIEIDRDKYAIEIMPGFNQLKKPPFETLYNLALALPFLA